MRKFKRKLHEQQNGIYSKPLPADDEDLDADDTTVGEEIPISPSPQMAAQLSVDRPPIEDDDFIPGSSEELSNSAKAIAKLVPKEESEWFYNQLHALLDKANDRAASDEDLTPIKKGQEREDELQEESVRKTIRRVLFEILSDEHSDEDVTEWDTFRFGDESPPPAEDPTPEPQQPADALSLEDLAAEFGYSGAPGIRQEINRLTDRMEYFATKVKKEDLDALVDFASGEYIDTLEGTGAMDKEDIDDLRKSSAMVKDMDSFRFFFISAFVLPAWKEVSREAKKEVESSIKALGIPKEIEQTVYNQVSGATSPHKGLIRKKLLKLANAGKVSADDIDQIEGKIRSAMQALRAMAEPSDDIVEKSLKKWQNMSQKKRGSVIRQAMDQTAEFQRS